MKCCHADSADIKPEKQSGPVRTGTIARCCVAILKGYKRFISPLLPPSCRFTPTCSEYAMESVQKHGVIRGLMFAVLRLLRCHPFAKGGYDPVK